jgi:peroxiredoxin
LTAGKKVIIFGVPGAFTPGCSKVAYAFIIFK